MRWRRMPMAICMSASIQRAARTGRYCASPCNFQIIALLRGTSQCVRPFSYNVIITEGFRMNRGVLIGLILLVIGAGAGAGAMWYILGGEGTPSQPISAPTLSLEVTEEVNTAATEVAQLRSDIDAALGSD